MMYGDAEIYVFPSELWEYACDNDELLRNKIVVIAELGQCEIALEKQNNDLIIAALVDGREIESEHIDTREDTIAVCRTYYARYFGNRGAEPEYTGEDDVDIDAIDHEIVLREQELKTAVRDMIDIVSDYDRYELTERDVENILDDVCALLSEYKIPVYYPQWVQDENGDEIFCEYPYDVEEIDD